VMAISGMMIVRTRAARLSPRVVGAHSCRPAERHRSGRADRSVAISSGAHRYGVTSGGGGRHV
jgi:hypothetical protein